MKLQVKEGKFWSGKLMDLANFEIIVTAFPQLAIESVNWRPLVFGVIIYMLLVVASIVIRKRRYAR